MKKLLILLLCVLPFLGTAQSASNSMENSFTAEKLTNKQVLIFQQRAIQKLQDFYDFLGIVSNPVYEKHMREDAKAQAKQMFYQADCTVDGKLAKTYIDSCFGLKTRLALKVVNVKVKDTMKMQANVLDNEYYQGVITFNLSSGTETTTTKTAYVVLARSNKQFGAAKKEVWTVFICDIK